MWSQGSLFFSVFGVYAKAKACANVLAFDLSCDIVKTQTRRNTIHEPRPDVILDKMCEQEELWREGSRTLSSSS